MQRARPSSRPTLGSKPRSLRAFEMSGTRISTSGPGWGLNTMRERDPAMRMMVSARPSTVMVAWGLPRVNTSPAPSPPHPRVDGSLPDLPGPVHVEGADRGNRQAVLVLVAVREVLAGELAD